MRIKLISDGTPIGTKLVDAKTGEVIRGVKAFDIHLDMGRPATVTLLLVGVPFEIETDVTRVIQEETQNAN